MGNVAKMYVTNELRFKVFDDYAFSRHWDNLDNKEDVLHEIDAEIRELDQIKKRLLKTRAAIQDHNKTSDDLLRETVERWVAVTELSVFNNQQYARILDVVYFYTHPNVEGVKIGFTNSLEKRIQQLDKQFNHSILRRKERTTPVLYLCPPEGIPAFRMEAALHFYHEKHNLRNEWFHKQPILEWLNKTFTTDIERIALQLGGVQ